MRFYMKLLWVIWMYTCTFTMTLCILILIGSNLWALLFPANDPRPAQCIEQGGTWVEEDQMCRTAA
jgi:hypothetical protein